MTKTQAMLSLLLLLVIIVSMNHMFSMDMFRYNNEKPIITRVPTDKFDGDALYQGDDQPSYFGVLQKKIISQ